MTRWSAASSVRTGTWKALARRLHTRGKARAWGEVCFWVIDLGFRFIGVVFESCKINPKRRRYCNLDDGMDKAMLNWRCLGG